jgi:NADP-dependent alcohol dehydrogenase
MKNFTYWNPVKIIFGSNSLDRLESLLPDHEMIMLVTGGGSIKKNGVYDKVKTALKNKKFIEFSGITPNPEYDTCMDAVNTARKNNVTFLLSAGGGSVLDATKFISAALMFEEGDPWDLVVKDVPVKKALPVGCVLTLPATGSEVNGNSVISRGSQGRKKAFSSPLIMPVFSILDPAATLTLSARQTANGIVDSFVHVMEQYLTFDVNTPLQDRQSEAILSTLIEVAEILKQNPQDINARANLMWSASNALSGLINCGVVQDWSTHIIGHEITVLHGLDHAQTLAIIFPALMRHQKKNKAEKIIQYGKRVWQLKGSDAEIIDNAILKTAAFFEFAGNPSTLSAYNISVESCKSAADNIARYYGNIGEHNNIGKNEVLEILNLCR